jgi:hypothetical protein
LVDLVLSHVTNKNNTTFKVKATWEVIITHISIPANDTLTV